MVSNNKFSSNLGCSRLLLVGVLAGIGIAGSAHGEDIPVSLVTDGFRKHLHEIALFHAPFDGNTEASRAVGDPKLYSTREGSGRATAEPGLPGSGAVRLDAGQGRHGDALYFSQPTPETVFFKGKQNLGYDPKGWAGACSFWMRLDPDADLPDGKYCDPLQFVAQDWNIGNMFVEFSKDHSPRHFRYAIMPVKRFWNPDNLDWEAMESRPMVAVPRPSFRRDQWTHIVFTFGQINSGEKDGWGELYIDGKSMGRFSGWQNTFDWEVDSSALTLGLNYVGWIDEITVFSRPLTEMEVRLLHAISSGQPLQAFLDQAPDTGAAVNP